MDQIKAVNIDPNWPIGIQRLIGVFRFFLQNNERTYTMERRIRRILFVEANNELDRKEA